VAATPSIKIVKTFDYRGTPTLFTNRYHFNGGTPAANADWDALFDAAVLVEKTIFQSNIEIVEAVAYAAGSDLPVHSKTYTTAGTGAFFGSAMCPGDCAALVRYATTARSTRNHPIYLFNYYHGVMRDTGGDADDLNTPQKTAMEAYADAWLAGFSDGTNTYVRAGPNGATAVSRIVKPEITHRDFPR
jgi:hypothetical protein